MRRIIKGLYLGSIDECDRVHRPTVHIGGNCNHRIEPASEHLHVPAGDDSSGAQLIRDMMPPIIAFINRWREMKRGVFVHCNAGCSRSPTVIYLYLRTIQTIEIEEYKKLVPEWTPNEWLQQLIA